MNDLDTLLFLILLLFSVILLFWLYRYYRVDKFRQQLFELRDNFFDEASKGNLGFDDPAYGMLRNAMNGFIRFGHRINIWQAIFLNLEFNKRRNRRNDIFISELNKNTINYTNTQKKIINKYYVRMNFIILEHLILSSPLLLVTIITPALFFYSARKHAGRLIKRFSSTLDKLDTAALVTSKI